MSLSIINRRTADIVGVGQGYIFPSILQMGSFMDRHILNGNTHIFTVGIFKHILHIFRGNCIGR